ncbi:uncharacterized protein LOC133493784 isoform X2 [Syngnathoides biaculeatus]|uniref:uncharacterized protein LOC133493784 isoform X2 n=1 Tax=Syngnathoides biaculeatus TaxID=300417 RepID=UPI002ADD9A72|nr:uncharacterized protein LOC133493784 isoform X2 [Syngnathoides biaculeatus]
MESEGAIILPEACFVSGFTRAVESRVKEALGETPPPADCPSARLFVVQSLRGDVVNWAHTNKMVCHPGMAKTRSVVEQRFWWPNLSKNVKDFVNACPICAANTWSQHVKWVEYAHNSLPFASTDSAVPSALALVRHCKRTWEASRRTLLRMGNIYKSAADRKRRAAPEIRVGQRMWLSTKDLTLRMESRKLAPRCVGPFPITKIINPVAVSLRLPRSMKVEPTFHIGRLRPDRPSPPAKPPPHGERRAGVHSAPVAVFPPQKQGVPVPGGFGGIRTGGALLDPLALH